MITSRSPFDSPVQPSPRRSAQSSDPWLGRLLGRYRIVSRLGEGGMGVVYRAEDRVGKRTVAIKLLAAALADDVSQLRRLLREAKSAQRLNHPNVVAVLDADRSGSTHFLVLEWVAGGSAQDFLARQGPFAWPLATWIAAEVCRGLLAAHLAGLVHRDVKPSNILLGRAGEVKLADFGLARANDQSTLTSSGPGHVLGTPHFMSPEQCRAEEVDESSDIYALGATYYALLTGQPPYPFDVPVQVMFAHCSRPIPDPRACEPAIPEACYQLVRRALAKRRDQRHPSALALLADLETILETERPVTRPLFHLSDEGAAQDDSTVREESGRRPTRRRWLLAACGAAGLAAIGGALTFRSRASKPIVPDTWESLSAAGQQAIRGNDAVAASLALQRLFDYRDRAVKDEETSAGLDAQLGTLADQLRAVLVAKPDSPDGLLLPTDGPVTGLSWSADLRWLAASCAGGEDGVHLWDRGFPEPRQTLWPGTPIHALAFSPDGQTLAAGCERGKVRCWRGSTQEVFAVGSRLDIVSGVAWCPRGRLLAVRFERIRPAAGMQSVAVWDTSAEQIAYRLPASAGRMYALAFSPLGSGELLACGEDGIVRIWDRDSGASRGQLATGFSAAISLSVFGSTLAVSGYQRLPTQPRRGLQLWDLRTRKRLAPELIETPLIRAVTFAPDGKLLASGAVSQVALWDVATRTCRQVVGKESKEQSCGQAFSPGGGLLAFGVAPSGVRIVDVSRVRPAVSKGEP